jgi:hypothetical protein
VRRDQRLIADRLGEIARQRRRARFDHPRRRQVAKLVGGERVRRTRSNAAPIDDRRPPSRRRRRLAIALASVHCPTLAMTLP